MSKAQWKPGPVVKSERILWELVSEKQHLFIRGRCYHYGWYYNWPIITLRMHFGHGAVRQALIVEGEWPESVELACGRCGTGSENPRWMDGTFFCQYCGEYTYPVSREPEVPF